MNFESSFFWWSRDYSIFFFFRIILIGIIMDDTIAVNKCDNLYNRTKFSRYYYINFIAVEQFRMRRCTKIRFVVLKSKRNFDNLLKA